MDSATDGWPSSVQDWSYCCEPSSTSGLPSLSRVTTLRSRTMPEACGVGESGLAEVLVAPAGLLELDDPDEPDAPAWDAPCDCMVPWLALMMTSANSSGSVSRPWVLMVS